MTIKSVRKSSAEDQWRIELSDGSVFSFSIFYLPQSCINLLDCDNVEGREISDEEAESFYFSSACLRAEKKALQLIARAEQNTFKLKQKLGKQGHDSKCVKAVIERLVEHGILDDSRYAALWLESRISLQAVSPLRLRTGLSSRGIGQDIIKPLLKEFLDEEKEQKLLERYAQKLMRKNDFDSLRYKLKSEGFSSFAINGFFESL